MKYCGVIQVNKSFTLSTLKKKCWEVGEMRKVIFFKGKITPVYLTSVDHPDFKYHLELIDTTDPICLDLEWRISFNAAIKNHASLFQFSTKNATLIVRHLSIHPSMLLKNFLETHTFVGKNTGNDRSRMRDLFGERFNIELEDIASTRLCPYGFSCNFNSMVDTFVGVPLFSIKDKTITMSNWERSKLAYAQVLYAAFDVVALQLALLKLPPPVEVNDSLKILPKPKVKKPKKVVKEKKAITDRELAKKLKEITFPIRDPTPDIVFGGSNSLTVKEALDFVNTIFDNDPSYIPHTLELVDDGNDLPDETEDNEENILRQKPDPE